MKKTITLCASVSHYKELIQIEKDLKLLGYKVLVPDTLRTMTKSNNFDTDHHKTWFKNPQDYSKKRTFILKHFKKIIKGDAVLIANFAKQDLEGYIGGNVLMEMTIAFHFKKPIFIYNNISENLSFKEEVYALGAKFLDGNLSKIKI